MALLHPEPHYCTEIPIENGELRLYHQIVEDPANWFRSLSDIIQWRQDEIIIHNNKVPIPRLQAWYGESHCQYAYSGIKLDPLPMPNELIQLKLLAESLCHTTFNCVLCNLYRNGQDSVSWHADDEPELGPAPTIASFSFGGERRFLIKPKKGKFRSLPIHLPDNSLLVMSGEMQQYWIHQVPKTQRTVGIRINLTYRYIPKQK